MGEHENAINAGLLSALKEIKIAGRYEHLTLGLCSLVRVFVLKKTPDLTFASLVLDKLTELMLAWPKFSGRRHFPVPGVDGHSPRVSYYLSPKWLGGYGVLRRELLDFCIYQLEKELKESASEASNESKI